MCVCVVCVGVCACVCVCGVFVLTLYIVSPTSMYCTRCLYPSPDDTKDVIDLERSVLAPLAGKGKLYVYKMTSQFWCQVKTAG